MKKNNLIIIFLSSTILLFSCGNNSRKYLESGNAKSFKKDYKGAIVDYTKAIDIDTSFSEAFFFRGDANGRLSSLAAISGEMMAEQDKGYYKREAIEDYTAAIKFNPKYFEAYFQRGSDLLTFDDSQTIYFGKDFLKKPKVEYIKDAIADFGKAIEINPKSDEAFRYRAIAKFTIEDYQGAFEDFTKAVEINPNNTEALDFKNKLGTYLDAQNNTNIQAENQSDNQEQQVNAQKNVKVATCRFCSKKFIWSNTSNDGVWTFQGYVIPESGSCAEPIDDYASTAQFALKNNIPGGKELINYLVNGEKYCSKKCVREDHYCLKKGQFE